MPATVEAARKSNPFADRFRNKFVTSGTTSGDLNARATVVMPKQAPLSRSTAPPPVPMSQMPLYLQRQMPGFNQPIVTTRDTANIQEVDTPPAHILLRASAGTRLLPPNFAKLKSNMHFLT